MRAAARSVMTFLLKMTVRCRRCYHRSVPSASPDAIIEDRIIMASFSVRTLGFPEVRCDDRPCPLALRKGLALLVYAFVDTSRSGWGNEAIA